MRGEKKKILFILPGLGAGGAERVLVTLMNNLDREVFDPVFLALNDEGPVRDWIAEDVAFHSFGRRTIKGSFFKLISFVRITKPDIIFTTMVHSNALAIAMKFFFPRVRVVVREAALPSAIVSRYGVKGRLCGLVYRFLYRYADIVLSNCSQMVDDFKHRIKIKTDNHRILFNPVDTQRLFAGIPEFFESMPGREDMVWFVSVGRLSYEKGYDRLIAALVDFHPDRLWRLDIIGGGDYRGVLEALIVEHGLQDHVFLRGYDSNPWGIATQADCLLLPSRWEGMPNVVLEGFACGLPAIAMREAGGVGDIEKYAGEEILNIVDTMDEFVQAMGDVEIRSKRDGVVSQLPDAFSLSYIMRQFEDILVAA